MRKMTKAMKEQFARYRKAYGKMSDEECMEMYEYDNNWCNSDEDAQEWLRNHLTKEMIEEKEIQEAFYKAPKPKAEVSKAELKKNRNQAKEAKEDRMTALIDGLKKYDFLFGELVEKTNTELKYIDSETGLPITIKFSKHKEQKVVSKVIKRKPIKNTDGTEAVAPYTSVELRSMAIENVMLANPQLFEAPSFAGTQMGFVCRDIKYPFGSIKLTHHRAAK